MTWSQYARARQMLAEERVGVAMRAEQRAEIEQIDATKAAIRKTQGR